MELYETQAWPEQQVPYPKTPTVMLYEGARMTHWGWPAEANRSDFPAHFFLQRVKLHLVPQGDDVPEGRHTLNPAVDAPLPPGVAALKAISDYLRAMREFIFDTIKRQGIDPVAKSILWCLTVPAIWTDAAKDTMIQAAQYAGDDDVEPL